MWKNTHFAGLVEVNFDPYDCEHIWDKDEQKCAHSKKSLRTLHTFSTYYLHILFSAILDL